MKSLVVARADVWLNGLKLRTNVVVCSDAMVSTTWALAGAVMARAIAAAAISLLFSIRSPFLDAGSRLRRGRSPRKSSRLRRGAPRRLLEGYRVCARRGRF